MELIEARNGAWDGRKGQAEQEERIGKKKGGRKEEERETSVI
jgi:hypothetical protein